MDPSVLAEEVAGLLTRNAGKHTVPVPPSVLREIVHVCDELQQVGGLGR
jgi:hypothetical protein